MSIRNKFGKKSVVAVVAVVFIAVIVVFAADIPGNDGVFHGCYKQNKGDLRVVENAAQCGNNEIHISWNQSGTQGVPGPQGPAGPQGPQGQPGPGGLTAYGNVREELSGGKRSEPCTSYREPVMTVPVNLTSPSIVNVFGHVDLSMIDPLDAPYKTHVVAKVDLLSGSQVIASRVGPRTVVDREVRAPGPIVGGPDDGIDVNGPLLGPPVTFQPQVVIVPAGSYVLRMTMEPVLTTNCNFDVFSTGGEGFMSFEAFAAP